MHDQQNTILSKMFEKTEEEKEEELKTEQKVVK